MSDVPLTTSLPQDEEVRRVTDSIAGPVPHLKHDPLAFGPFQDSWLVNAGMILHDPVVISDASNEQAHRMNLCMDIAQSFTEIISG